MNIGIFTDTFSPNVDGVVTFLEGTNEELRKRNDISIFSPFCGKAGKKNYKVYLFNSWPLPFYGKYRIVPFIGTCVKTAMEKDLDIIHSHTQYFMGHAAKKASEKLNVPLVSTFHTAVPEYLPYYIPMFGHFLKHFLWNYVVNYFNGCTLVIAPSLHIKKVLKSHGVKTKIRILRGVVDTDFFRPGGKEQENIVLHVGRITKERNMDVLINAEKIIEKKNPKIKFVIVGDGPCRKQFERICDKNVKFTGYVSNKKLLELYQKCALFVTPSTTDTLGLVVGEAMACGKAVIGPDKGGVADLIENGKNGLTFKSNSSESLAEKIEYILDNEAKRRNMGRSGIKKAKTMNKKIVAKELEKIYNSLV